MTIDNYRAQLRNFIRKRRAAVTVVNGETRIDGLHPYTFLAITQGIEADNYREAGKALRCAGLTIPHEEVLTYAETP